VGAATLYVPNVVCLQQFCTQCEQQPDIDVDCLRCGKRRHSFSVDPVGDLLTYLCKPRRWCNKIAAIAHNAKSFDSQFILYTAVVLKRAPELILNGLKIACMKMEHMTFLDSASHLPIVLRKLPRSIWSFGEVIMVPTLLQYEKQSGLRGSNVGHRVLRGR
jgi:hypothetical protein